MRSKLTTGLIVYLLFLLLASKFAEQINDFSRGRMQILGVTSPHPSLSHQSESVGRRLCCLVLLLRAGQGTSRDRFVIKAPPGKSLLDLSTPMRMILLERDRVCNTWVSATQFTALHISINLTLILTSKFIV